MSLLAACSYPAWLPNDSDAVVKTKGQQRRTERGGGDMKDTSCNDDACPLLSVKCLFKDGGVTFLHTPNIQSIESPGSLPLFHSMHHNLIIQ